MKKFTLVICLGLVGWVLYFVADIYDWPPQPKTKYDVEIISKTIELLNHNDVWDKQDDRYCKFPSEKLSLYCALKKASLDVSGDFHHESAVMEAVRDSIIKSQPTQKYQHLLMDYNNSKTVSLKQVHAVLEQAKIEVLQ